MTSGPKQPIRALLVDDDPMLLALLGAFLEERGYAVEEAGDGVQALQSLDGASFNLVITDRNMPNMDGLALCRAIRAHPREGYVYCIMLTASDDEKSLVAAMEAGVDDFLSKPLSPAELGARLRAAERVLALEAQMAARNRELGKAYAQLSRDLELARSLQLSQLPSPQDLGGMRCEGMFEASSFVGGDFYDYFPLGSRFAGFYLADVSGHGVAAAMLAVAAQHRLRAASQEVARGLSGPADLPDAAVRTLTLFNRRFLQQSESGLYLTVVFGLLDRETGQAALVHAGHPLALLADAGSTTFQDVGDSSVPVGVLDEPGFVATSHLLARGSRLVLYSDGITECPDAQGRPFGEQRLRDVLARERAADPNDACRAVRERLREWHGGAFDDDVTLLVVEPG